jgi:hypothetical protein
MSVNRIEAKFNAMGDPKHDAANDYVIQHNASEEQLYQMLPHYEPPSNDEVMYDAFEAGYEFAAMRHYGELYRENERLRDLLTESTTRVSDLPTWLIALAFVLVYGVGLASVVLVVKLLERALS